MFVFGKLAFAALLGLLSAVPVADATGIDTGYDPSTLRVICGVLVGLLVFFLLRGLWELLTWLIGTLRRTSQRPSSSVAITCLVMGAVLVIAGVAIQMVGSPLDRQVVNLKQENAAAKVRITVQPPLLFTLTSFLVIAIGIFLLGIGLWASLAPTSSPHWSEGIIPAENVPGVGKIS